MYIAFDASATSSEYLPVPRIPPVVTDPFTSADGSLRKGLEDCQMKIKQWNQKWKQNVVPTSAASEQQGNQSGAVVRTGSRPEFLEGEKIDISYNHIFNQDTVIPLAQFEGSQEWLVLLECMM